MKVALVIPNFAWCDWDENTRWHFIPYNLCMLGAMIEDLCEVVLIDANLMDMDDAAFTAELAVHRPDVVGISVLMDQYGPTGHHAARLAKEHDPRVVTVMGGVYPTMNTEKVIADPLVDFVLSGEGEYVFRELLRYLLGQRRDVPTPGIAYREDGVPKLSGHAPFIEDLDALPLPAYHLIDYLAYTKEPASRRSVDSAPGYPYARLFSSRGCPYGCSFCQVEAIQGKKTRVRSPDNVCDEIEWLKDTYGIKSLIFDDDNLFTYKPRARALFQRMIDRNLALPWVSIATAAFRIDDDLIELMRKSGCEYLDIAIESGNERVLREIVHKPLDLQHAKEVSAKARAEGIFVAANFMIGFPSETWDEIRDTLHYAEELDCDYVKIFVTIPLQQTELYDMCVAEGALKEGFTREAVRWSTGQIETDHFKSRDLTILRAYEWDRINFTEPDRRRRIARRMGLTEDELWQKRRNTLVNAAHFVDELAAKPVSYPVPLAGENAHRSGMMEHHFEEQAAAVLAMQTPARAAPLVQLRKRAS
jgi:radical SAM superfamily enzyme YgiQ (UPF0313 family)